jgi:hypothetical protein
MSLQFPSRSRYFSALAMRYISLAAAGVLAACGTRERPTFPLENPGNGSGPFTMITQPDGADTLLIEGDPFVLIGLSADPDGVDVVNFEVAGAGVSYAPLNGGGADTVRFSIELPTIGHSGDTIVVRVSAVDEVGDRGPIAMRQIRIQ